MGVLTCGTTMYSHHSSFITKFSRQKYWGSIFLLIYILGSYQTIKSIEKNIQRYFKYPSIFTQREDNQVSTFPKITVCSYQMHSKKKLLKYYPNVNTTVLRAFYGIMDKSLDFNKDAWDEFREIDLDTFFNLTKPDIKVEHCLFDNLDCRHIWKVRKTKLGNCLEFDLHHEIEQGHFIHLSRIDLTSSEHNLGFVIGLNKSDGSYGWYGNMHGLHLYYNYFTDQVEEEEKSISLSPQLTPTVNFKLIKNSYLNEPYTPCRESFLADKYIIFKHEEVYKKSICEMRYLMEQVYQFCHCCPNYMHDQIFNDSHLESAPLCTFYDNVRCVANVIDRNGLTRTPEACKPACKSFEFNQDSIQYRIAPSNARGDFYYMTGVFRTSEERVTIVEEQTVYTFDELIADIGGGLGLILGLSVIKMVHVVYYITMKTRKQLSKLPEIIRRKSKERRGKRFSGFFTFRKKTYPSRMESSDYSGNSSTISTPSSFKRFWNFGFKAPDSPDTGFITRKNSCAKDLHKDFPGMSIDPPPYIAVGNTKTGVVV